VTRHKTWFPLAATVLISLSATSCASQSPQVAVEKRFDAYMKAWIDRDIDGVWNAMSPRLKQGNGNTRAAYRKFVEEQNIYFVRYNRLETKVAGSHAQVIADMAITDSAKTETVEERQRCDLILEKGTWYIDDCKPLNPPV
jgi:hypothetical protein